MKSPVAERSRRASIRLAALIALAPLSCTSVAAPWTYHGQLNDGGQPANGEYDIRLTLLDARQAKSIGSPVTFHRVPVSQGAFSIDVDFDADLVDAPAMRLKTEVAQGGSGFVALGEPVIFEPKGSVAACWDTKGNTGTNGATDFLGTVDSQSLSFRVNNQRRLRLDGGDNTLGGSAANSIESTQLGQTISGGGSTASNCGPDSDDACRHQTTASWATIGGGVANVAGLFATVAGGQSNQATSVNAAVGGGGGNVAKGDSSVIAGGFVNKAAGNNSVVSGGANNQAPGQVATAFGGLSNCAGGDFSAAGGSRAKVRHGTTLDPCGTASGDSNGDEGTFAWADAQFSDFTSSGPNQFIVRAQGGVGINLAPIDAAVELMIAADADNSDVANLWLKERDSNNGILMSAGNASTTINNNAEFFIDHYNGTTINRRMELRNTGEVIIRSNITAANTGVSMAANAGSWSSLSDRRLKTAISAIDPVDVLDRLVAMPISEWSYIAQGEAVRHIGPMAQDFAAAFAVGENDTTISTIDADGVALAAIQGLSRLLTQERDRLTAEQRRNDVLQAQVEALTRRLDALQASSP